MRLYKYGEIYRNKRNGKTILVRGIFTQRGDYLHARVLRKDCASDEWEHGPIAKRDFKGDDEGELMRQALEWLHAETE